MDLIASPPRLSLAAPPTEVRRPSRPSRAVLLTALLIDGNAPPYSFRFWGCWRASWRSSYSSLAFSLSGKHVDIRKVAHGHARRGYRKEQALAR
jgi:hypothetical protein